MEIISLEYEILYRPAIAFHCKCRGAIFEDYSVLLLQVNSILLYFNFYRRLQNIFLDVCFPIGNK